MSKQTNAALAEWARNYKYNTKLNVGRQSAASTELKTYQLDIKQIKNLKIPQEIQQRGDIETSLQVIANVFQEDQFIGRTYIGKTIKLDEKLQLLEQDYVLLNTKSLEKTSIVLEFLLVAKEII